MVRSATAFRWALTVTLLLSAAVSGCARPRGLIHTVMDPCCTGEPLGGAMCCRPCALGQRLHCRHGKHGKHGKHKHDRPPIELPPEDMPDFPRFHPVPVQPVFSRRDVHGFPMYGAVPTAAVPPGDTEIIEEIPGGELMLPDPSATSQRQAAAAKNATTASWLFTPQPPERYNGPPPRHPRPQFADEPQRAAMPIMRR